MFMREENTGLFAQYYMSVKNAISNDNGIIENIIQYNNDVERMKFLDNLSGIIEQHDNILQIERKYCGKNAAIAAEYKEKGNLAFKNKIWHEAVSWYSNSYVALLDYQVQEKAIILANRSAALYHLCKYDETLHDIKRALDHGYPKELLYKLYERQARCCLAKKDYAKAICCFQKFLTSLDNANIPSSEKRSKMNLDAMTMIKMLEQDSRTIQQQQQQQKQGKKEKSINQKEFLNPSIKFDENPEEGRFAVAHNTINVAEEVLVENAFVAVLLPKFSQTHCEHCFKRTTTPVACRTCADVIYCSEECCNQAYKSYHKYECGLLYTLRNSGASVNCQMALRVVASQSKENLLQVAEQVDRKFTIAEILQFSKNDYRRICHLVRHETARTGSNFFQHALMARFLIKCLEKGDYFDEKTTNEEKIIISGLMLRTLQLLQYNTHEVAELRKSVKDGQEKTVFIGGALYPTLALFNHSCDPGVVRYFCGTTVHVNTIKDIPAGRNISENYGPIYTQANRDERRAQLKELYRFNCLCTACLENWPTFDQLPIHTIRFRCEALQCQAVIEIPAATCNDFMIKCVACGEMTNIFKGLKVIQDTERMTQTAKHYYEAANYINALKRFSDLIKIMNEVLVPPFPDYCQCQQFLKDCFLHLGNCYNLN